MIIILGGKIFYLSYNENKGAKKMTKIYENITISEHATEPKLVHRVIVD